MAYTGVIIALDLAGTTGVAEGCPGEVPRLSVRQFKHENEPIIETCARGMKFLLERISSPRFIGNRSYGRGEAANDGMVRVVIEAPILVPMPGKRNADSHTMSLGLFTALGGLAQMRGVMVVPVGVGKVRKGFIGQGRLDGTLAKRSARMMCEALGWQPPNLDAADAGAVWWWACREWNPEATPLTEPLFSHVRWEP